MYLLNTHQIDVTAKHANEKILYVILAQSTLSFKKHKTIMAVASLIETMTFQEETNPPGGAMQENGRLDDRGKLSHTEGVSVMVYNHAISY